MRHLFDFDRNQTLFIYHSPIPGMGIRVHINSEKLLVAISIHPCFKVQLIPEYFIYTSIDRPSRFSFLP